MNTSGMNSSARMIPPSPPKPFPIVSFHTMEGKVVLKEKRGGVRKSKGEKKMKSCMVRANQSYAVKKSKKRLFA